MKEIRVKNPLLDDLEEAVIVIEGERNGEETEERFECLGAPPAAAIHEIRKENGSIVEYVRLCLKPGEEQRFDRLLKDKTFNPQIETVRAAYYGLLEHYAERPTNASSASGRGRDETETSSTDAGLEPALTSEQS